MATIPPPEGSVASTSTSARRPNDAAVTPTDAPSTTSVSSSDPSSSSSIFNLNTLFENPLFAGGIGLAGLGAVAATARKGALVAAGAARRRLLVNLEISRQDPAYPWILAWLSQLGPQPGFIASRLTRINNFSVTTTAARSSSSSSSAAGAAGGRPSFFVQPGYGRHIVRYRWAYIGVNREKHNTANMNTGEPHEIVQLTTLWAHRHIFDEVLQEARGLAERAHEGKTVVKKRPLGSVVLDEGVKERIVGDVQDFLDRQQWYVDRGIPYRRGYLLYGPPGTGKSSFIQALAGELNYSVAMINLSEMGMTDDKLAYLLTKLPKRSILLLEDADAAFVNRRQRDADGYSGATVTFSGLLNALDGVAAGEERLAFLTTNHIDRLDPALKRPGRVDVVERIGEVTTYQATQMWDRFYGDVDADGKGRELFLGKLGGLGLLRESNSTKLQESGAGGLFLMNKENMMGAIEMAEEYFTAEEGHTQI
ncbi:unnamed protein product [Parascedosporium putredinis]|uniref:Mitochondrial chaperone BCS1 n=1 Tax=Parascedosporium putredinis TaxID=1442378 RepID=A0A9P1H735_9PEZI|nr:unnamed protein product [Parascedosporium putredinis]CAI7999332.1 unnamed protein product [Parascedosporium putredinis]